MIEVVRSYNSDFNCNVDELNNITVGKPYVIYDLELQVSWS